MAAGRVALVWRGSWGIPVAFADTFWRHGGGALEAAGAMLRLRFSAWLAAGQVSRVADWLSRVRKSKMGTEETTWMRFECTRTKSCKGQITRLNLDTAN